MITIDNKYYINIPTWEDNKWSYTSFTTREEFRDFVLSIFKEPGKYQFDSTVYQFNTEAVHFRTHGFYTMYPANTKDYIKYWDDQKNKCRVGVIFKTKDSIWYLPRELYMWLNFLQVFDKMQGKFDFAQIWDTQYHLALYECLAELFYKHSVILKKRQVASSYYHTAKLINQIWFEEGVTLKMGASLKDYINDKGSWKFLNEYAKFLNENTAWYRPMNPDKVMLWQQKIEKTLNGRKIESGLKGTIQGLTLDKNPTNGVGGPVKYFFYEEGGIAPTADQTYGFMKPALKMGMVTTGMFIIAGSVGDLDQCEPLKEYIYHPEPNQFYAVDSNLIDDKGTLGKTGLFIPEQWSMPPYIDEFGNSKVEAALEALDIHLAQVKKDLTPEAYQLEVSQHPRNIAEAFAHRKVAIYPPHLVSAQLRRIEDKEYPYELLDLTRDDKGLPICKLSNKLPILEFPISKTREDKEGVLVVWERPIKDPQFTKTYYASIDPVSEGKVTTSESLCAIYIYKNDTIVHKEEGGTIKTFIERGKIVAAWCGRFDDLTKTHERLEIIIEWYNAWTIVENNIPGFIQYMMYKKKQKYLVTKDQMIFLKEAQSNTNVFQEYGWRNTGNLFSSHLVSDSIEFLTEELDHVTKEDGTIVKTTYGVERIPDPMLLTEMQAYQKGVNVDRLVAFAALTAFIKVQDANGRRNERTESDPKNLQKSDNLYKLNKSAFTHMGMSRTKTSSPNRPSRNPFKNLH